MSVLAQANDIVRRKWRTTDRGWKVFLVIAIIILAGLGLVGLITWGFIGLLKSLAVGVGSGRYDLYFPAGRRRR